MFVSQVSVFVENREGRLAAITEVLSRKEINIRALCLADTSSFGVLRLIVDDPEVAQKALVEEGFTVSRTNVIGVEIADVTGGLDLALKTLDEGKVNIEYMYAFVSKVSGKAFVIMRVEDTDEATGLLSAKGFRMMDGSDMSKY